MPRSVFTPFFRRQALVGLAGLAGFVAIAATVFSGCAEPSRRDANAGASGGVSKSAASSPSAMSSSRSVSSDAYRGAWDVAVEAYRKGDYLLAVGLLDKMPQGDSLASLYRSSLSASARLRAGDTAGADKVVAGALAVPFVTADSVWVGHFHRLRMRTLSALPPGPRRDYLRGALKTPIAFVERVAVLYRLLEADTILISRGERLEFLRRIASSAPVDARLDAAYRRARVVFAGDDSREAQRVLLDLEERLSLWSEAAARGERIVAAARDSGDTTTDRAVSQKLALWYYNKGSYSESIRQYEGVLLRFGESAEAMLQIARGYRSMGRDEASRDAYTRLVARFPKDSRAAEVLWMRAFDFESSGALDTALAGYERIAADFPQHARAGEAKFRAGLVRLRQGDVDGAAASFAALRASVKTGKLVGAARYWEGKALAARGDSGDASRASAARAAWVAIVRDHPFGHYGHLARAELLRRGALPDSLGWARMLNRADGAAVAQWLDAVTPGVAAPAPGFGESRLLPVRALFELGLDTLAVLTLQARANAASGAIRPWYEAAVSCREAGFDYEAYRFGQRLADKLPLERWPSAPVVVLRLFYPPSYDVYVKPAAERNGVPARLATALIKQESGFDPKAVSRVGARGLMQLMPTTGAQQARKEGMTEFHPDSLFVPAVNVRLGVAYLGDVLRQRGGDVSLALAHYNAGPTALDRWMPRLAGRPPEDVAENIGYAETREYVKRVGANWKTYAVLWGDTSRTSGGAP